MSEFVMFLLLTSAFLLVHRAMQASDEKPALRRQISQPTKSDRYH